MRVSAMQRLLRRIVINHTHRVMAVPGAAPGTFRRPPSSSQIPANLRGHRHGGFKADFDILGEGFCLETTLREKRIDACRFPLEIDRGAGHEKFIQVR